MSSSGAGSAGYIRAIAAISAATLAGFAMEARFDPVNIAMVYLLAVVVIALRDARGPAMTAALLGVLSFDLLFVPPRGTLDVDDAQYLFTFGVMLAVAWIISGLVASVRARALAQSGLEAEARAERMRSALLSSISHDLRTPLAVMQGASSTLRERGADLSQAERDALATDIFEQAGELGARISKILQMTRLEAGAPRLDADWTSIEELASSALEGLARALAKHRVLVALPDDLPLIRVDAVLIEQVLANLLENAARHTPEGTPVQFSASASASEVVVSVEDFPGAPPAADVSMLFEKFGGERGANRGVGLGLAICRAIVVLHGGRIWAEPTERGLAVRFALPRTHAPAPPEPEAR